MFRFLIEDIMTKIGADLPEFKTVALFNDDFNKNEQGLTDIIKFPALFIGFPEGVTFTDGGAGVQKTSEIVLRFYIAKSLTKGRASNNTTVLDLLDLKQKVYKTFQGYKSNGFNTFKRRSEQTDEARTNFYVFIQDYTTDILDDTKYVDGGATTHQITALDITDDIVINPATKPGIRTAKDVNDQ